MQDVVHSRTDIYGVSFPNCDPPHAVVRNQESIAAEFDPVISLALPLAPCPWASTARSPLTLLE